MCKLPRAPAGVLSIVSRADTHSGHSELLRPACAAGPDDILPTFLKAIGPTAKTELLSIFNKSFSKGVVRNLEGSHHSPAEKGRQTARSYLLLPTCQPHILCCQDNGENGAQPSIQSSREDGFAANMLASASFAPVRTKFLESRKPSVMISRPPSHNAA